MLFLLHLAVARSPRAVATRSVWKQPIAYTFDAPSFEGEAASMFATVLDAMTVLEEHQISFTRKNTSTSLLITASESCRSTVGFGETNKIELTPDCGFGTVLHELLHALGFVHEQNHPNRSAYITVSLNESHYESDWASQWVDVYSDALSTPFDPCSIMMYTPDAPEWADEAVTFTALGLKAAEECIKENRHLYSFTTSISDYVSADHNNVVQRNGLSAKDIVMLRTLYPSTPPTTVDHSIIFWSLLLTTILIICVVLA